MCVYLPCKAHFDALLLPFLPFGQRQALKIRTWSISALFSFVWGQSSADLPHFSSYPQLVPFLEDFLKTCPLRFSIALTPLPSPLHSRFEEYLLHCLCLSQPVSPLHQDLSRSDSCSMQTPTPPDLQNLTMLQVYLKSRVVPVTFRMSPPSLAPGLHCPPRLICLSLGLTGTTLLSFLFGKCFSSFFT